MGPAGHRYSEFGLRHGGNGPRCADLAQGSDRFNLFLFYFYFLFLTFKFEFILVVRFIPRLTAYNNMN
jgi:hypothetical protein